MPDSVVRALRWGWLAERLGIDGSTLFDIAGDAGGACGWGDGFAMTPRAAMSGDEAGEWVAYGPPAPTSDAAESRQQIRALLNQGMAEVRVGVGIGLETVQQRTDARIASRRK